LAEREVQSIQTDIVNDLLLPDAALASSKPRRVVVSNQNLARFFVVARPTWPQARNRFLAVSHE
jgi:hypothetical protein